MWLIVLFTLLFLLVGLGFLYPVSGVWERMEDEQDKNLYAKDQMTLAQLGPLVMGKQELASGRRSFLGLMFGPYLVMRRRDYGTSLLMKQGFPEPIAKQLEGQVMVRLRLKLSSDRLFLNGQYVPYKVEFNLEPPSVTSMHALKPVARNYRRVELIRSPNPVTRVDVLREERSSVF